MIVEVNLTEIKFHLTLTLGLLTLYLSILTERQKYFVK